MNGSSDTTSGHVSTFEDCDCRECALAAAIDLAIATGHRIAIDTTDQLVIPDVIVLELWANGIDVTDEPGYPAIHRTSGRACSILSPGVVV